MASRLTTNNDDNTSKNSAPRRLAPFTGHPRERRTLPWAVQAVLHCLILEVLEDPEAAVNGLGL